MILTALNNYYDRLSDQGIEGLPPYGYSNESISYCLQIDTEGNLIDVIPLLDTSGKKPRPSVRMVPNPPKRASNISPCFLWDKTSYVLGLTASDKEKDLARAKQTHQAFKEYHQQWLADSEDEGIKAILCFLEKWNPEDEDMVSKIPSEAIDTNVVFRLNGDKIFLHQRPVVQKIRALQLSSDSTDMVPCLITGDNSVVTDLHPSIRGVNGAQSSGASLVSFNQNSFESYGKKQGHNAPVSNKAAFAYGTVLNYLLRRDESNKQRLQLGDTTVVFWAESDVLEEAENADDFIGFCLSPKTETDEDDGQITALAEDLIQVAKGRPIQELGRGLNPETRIYILGLAPNAARLSIRFWQVNTLEHFTRCLSAHYQDLYLDPQPWKNLPAIWRLLSETVPHRAGSKPKLDDVSPQLAGELTRAILTGRRYPRSLLTNLIMRMRADGDISPLRVALCKAVLARESRLNSQNDKEIPVSLDTDNKDPGYLLGRLFSSLESAQRAALGKGINATIKDRFYGAASATPATIFPMLLRNTQNHFSKIRKTKGGLAVSLEKQIGEIIDKLAASFPKTLGIEEQGRFAIGYYHQRNEIFKKHEPELELEEGDSE